jgi:hypothetical protein
VFLLASKKISLRPILTMSSHLLLSSPKATIRPLPNSYFTKCATYPVHFLFIYLFSVFAAWRVVKLAYNLRHKHRVTCLKCFAFKTGWFLLRAIFWVVSRRVVFNSRRFGTRCLFHLHRRVDMKCVTSYPLAYEDGTDTVFRNIGY